MPLWVQILNLAVWIPVLILMLVSYPFVLLYRALLCALSWYVLASNGAYVLVIQSGTRSISGHDYESEILELTANRAVLLNFAEYKNWPKWSLAARLFWAFGPIGMPLQFTAHNLPAVIVLRKFCRPRRFIFGSSSKERPAALARLASELQL